MPAPLVSVLDGLYAMARPLLFQLEPERAHTLVLQALTIAGRDPRVVPLVRRLLLPRGVEPVTAFGLRFPNRVGLAAGLDKNALALNAWAALGFGHVEIGTVTPRAQPGNPAPRLFRLPGDRALINRLGFPNDGAEVVAGRLGRRPRGLIVGGNIGKGRDTPLENAADDYRRAATCLGPLVDYLTINVSSPNTPGLRQLQTPDQLATILVEVRRAAGRPVLVKLAPDLDDTALPDLVAAAKDAGAAGLIAANTTLSRMALRYPSPVAHEAGGLSGAPIAPQIRQLTRRLADLAGDDLTVISVGGISTAQDVRERVSAGAALVQVYTALIYAGPGLVARLLSC